MPAASRIIRLLLLVAVAKQVICDCRDGRDGCDVTNTGLVIHVEGSSVLIRSTNCGDGAPPGTDPNKDTTPPLARLRPAPDPCSDPIPITTEASKLTVNVLAILLALKIVATILMAGPLVITKLQRDPEKDDTKAPTATNHKKVFLSHTGRTATRLPFVTGLFRELERRGIPPFVDYEGIELGTKWAKKIEEKARTCQVFVCILCMTYFEQYWCMHELDLALEHDRTILVVINDGCERLLKDFKEASFRRMYRRNPMVSEHELDRWCRNIQELRQFQQLWNLHKGKRAEERFLVEVVSAVEDLLNDVSQKHDCQTSGSTRS